MKKKCYPTVVLFCGFLGIMAILYGLLPEKTFSDREKRYLEERPAFSAQALASGEWGENVESWMADHMPGRDFFVGLNAYFDRFTGRQRTKDIWVQGDRLLEAPCREDPAAIRSNMASIRDLARKLDRDVDLMIVPSAGYFQDIPDYRDGEILDSIGRECEERIQMVDLTGVLDGDCFYRTDHHWTSRGAYLGYETYAKHLGLEPRTEFRKEISEGFRGSTYSRSALWLTPGENVELWHGSPELTVDIGGETHEGIFWRENLREADQYTVFLGGNHPLVTIHNPDGRGKLLVIRDSFSNCLGGFLAESFREVTLVDLRYYKQSVVNLANEGDYDHILVCYGLHNFLTDKNMVFLAR